MTVSNEQPLRTYGHWRKPRSVGLGKLSGLATVLLFAGAPIVILVLIATNIWGALIAAVIVAGAIWLISTEDKHGRTVMARIATRAAWRRGVRAKLNVYRSGPLGFVPFGRNQLPGLGAQVQLTEWLDAYQRPFGLLHVPLKDHFTVVFSGEPTGGALVDQSQVDTWVAMWGHWLSALGNEAGIVAASVTIETAPDYGTRLRAEVATNLDPLAPKLAADVLNEITQTYPRGSATVKAYISVTFSGQIRGSGQKATVDEISRDLAARLSFFSQMLNDTGAGAARPMSAQEICELVRIAYDPAAASEFATARAQGNPVDLDWSDVGPVGANTGWDYYKHDSGVSRTWQMSQAPRGVVYSHLLRQLLEPTAAIARKRVTMLYRPIDPALAVEMVEQDRRSANVRATSTAVPSLRAMQDRHDADVTAREEATGAGLVNFGMLVTATVLDESELRAATAAIENQAARARLFLRPVTGSQDSAFIGALPLGLVLPEYQVLPSNVRNKM